MNEKKLFIETYGCQMNMADSEVVASIMKMAGYALCDNIEEADAIFVNTCSIRDNAEQRVVSRLQYFNSLRRKNRRLIVGVLGCMAERVKESLLSEHHADLVVGPDAYLDLPHLVASVENGEKAINVELSTTETYKQVIPTRIGANRISGFISIMRGCNNFCSYCIVPYTRGRERSREPESILQELQELRRQGFKEATLLGQNVNSYHFTEADGRVIDFPALLAIVAEAAPDMRIRFTTSHPKDMSDETLHTIARYPNLCRHIHLPVQSGNNRILALMNRKYTREWYLDRIAPLQILRTPRHLRRPQPARRRARRGENRAPATHDRPAKRPLARKQPPRHRPHLRGARRGFLAPLPRTAVRPHATKQDGGLPPHRRRQGRRPRARAHHRRLLGHPPR